MPLTCTGCSVSVPALSASCGQNKKSGGIPYLAFVACDNTTIAAAPTDASVWATAIGANDARVIKNLLGELPAASANMRRFISCAPEGIQGKTWTLNVQDYDFTETAGPPVTFDKEVFYNTIQADPSKYHLYYGSCDGRMWLVSDFTIMMNVIVPNNNQENRYMEITINYLGLTMGTQYVFDLGQL